MVGVSTNKVSLARALTILYLAFLSTTALGQEVFADIPSSQAILEDWRGREEPEITITRLKNQSIYRFFLDGCNLRIEEDFRTRCLDPNRPISKQIEIDLSYVRSVDLSDRSEFFYLVFPPKTGLFGRVRNPDYFSEGLLYCDGSFSDGGASGNASVVLRVDPPTSLTGRLEDMISRCELSNDDGS